MTQYPIRHSSETEEQEAASASSRATDLSGLPTPTTESGAEQLEDAEVIQASIKAGSVAQIVVATVAVLGLIYVLKFVLTTTLTALLLAFALEPLVSGLRRIGIPRWAGALVAVLLMIALAAALTFFFYNRAVDFATALPKYSGRIRNSLSSFRSQSKKIEESTRSVMGSPPGGRQAIPVEVQESPGISRMVWAGGGILGEVVLAISFVPFLVYFMLTWKEHAHHSTVQLFPKEHRLTAFRTVGRISLMIRSFIGENIILGLVNTIVSGTIFWLLGIPYFYFIGVISGFASLVPYLGVFLAILPPLAGGIDTLSKTGVAVVIASVVLLHILTMNVLYPKIVGRKLRLNPLAVTLSLLFWAWIWGGMGLLLAVPVVGATKIVCDHIESLQGVGKWLGD
jgi:predicted PurR-regulated permease PerM